ncbi:MAG: class I SAM-dependent methyltransferase [Actinomycetota bacterium]|nr:class I SAM-dependent methyltransferase [Actinomycetota bacterium]
MHHLWDVAGAVTVAGYDQHAAAYRGATAARPDGVRAAIDALVAALPAGARVLEIGSGAGRDAAALEAGGLSVRRTDITPGFVELLRADGHRADVLDPLTDDLADPERPGVPYDAVWANASLLHVARADLPVVLRRLAEATRPDGLFRLSLKEGDGEGWSTHGSVPTPRRFVYWREQRLREVLTDAGWQVLETEHAEGLRGDSWLSVVAVRR